MDRAPSERGSRGFVANEPAVIRAAAVVASAVTLVCAPACTGAGPGGPPEIRLGVDVCDGCGMAIAQPRYAAAAVADDGGERRVLKFDDIGCLARWEAGTPGATVRGLWVHDSKTAAWVEAGKATFVQSHELSTPMGYGLAAFESASAAGVLAAERAGRTLSWSAILGRARDGSLQTHPDRGRDATR